MTGPRDQESTQVGMPVPPSAPGYVQGPPGPYSPPPPPPGYGSPPGYGPPPAGYPPTQPGYGGPPPGGPPPGGYPPPGYGYGAPPPKRGGRSGLLIGLLVLLIVVALGVGAMYAAHLGPFATAQVVPTPSHTPQATIKATATPTVAPTPTLIAVTPSPTPTIPPTLPPTLPPTPSPSFPPTIGPSGSPSDAQAELLSHVPPTIAASCSPTTATGGAIAAVACLAGDNSAFAVTYALYPDQATMQAEYDSDKDTFAADAGSDSCEKKANWPSEYGYTIANVHVGRVFCFSLFGLPEIYWTDERYSILSNAFTATETEAALYSFWANESGPY
jgi:hypothetical protein